MHNIISHNKLASWNHNDNRYAYSKENKLLDDYYECLVECVGDQPSCKRICKELLM